ncbi:MAG: MATE family efflux transporter [Acholeplasmatales bacterium]
MSKVKSKLKNYIGTKAFYKTAFAIIIPVVIQQMILSIAGFVDNFMINGYSVNAYAGVSTANRFMFIVNFFWIGLTAAISIFVSQYYGAKDKKNIIGTFQLGLLLAVTVSLISTVVIIFTGPLLIKSFLPLDEPNQLASVQFGIDYVTVIGYGAIFFLLPFMISVFFRSTGRPKVPLVAGIIGIIVNVSLNYVLIYGHFGFPEMGATGAALATVISKIVELVVLIIFAVFFSNEKYVREIFKKPVITGRLVSMYFKKGIPIIANEVLWAFGMVLFAKYITSGVYEWVTAYGYSQTATDIFFVYYSGMGTASGILIGQALGENDFEKAKDHLKKLRGIMMITNIVVIILIATLSPAILLFLTPINDLYWLAYKIILVNLIFIIIYGYNAVSYYALRAGGDTVRSFLVDQLPTYLVGVPTVMILSKFRHELHIDILIIFLASKASDIFKLYLSISFIKKGVWLKNLTIDDLETA